MSRISQLMIGFVALLVAILSSGLATAQDRPELQKYLTAVNPSDLVPDADAFGPIREDLPVAAVLSDGQTIGWAFVTTDFVGTTGYSGKPIDILAAVSPDAVLTGAILGKHSEPIVLIGIPESQMRESIAGYVGTDLKLELTERGSSHELDIISGATVTVVVIEDSVIRAGLKVARALGLGGLTPPTAPTGPTRELDTEIVEERTWTELAGDGSVRRLTLDVGQVNGAFVDLGDRRAIDRPEPGESSEVYIDLVAALVSVPSIGISLLGEAEYGNLTEWLDNGDHAVLIAGRGRYSFKGSGYVRGGIFDRISVLQGDTTLRFRDRMHRRLGEIAAAGTPDFDEIDLFRIPASSEFDPAEPWDLQLLVQRAVGPVDKAFLTFELGYRLPDRYLRIVPQPSSVSDEVTEAEDEAAA
ncbi:MAG: regulatory protein NosR, partial [Boseongicola sp.]